MSNEKPIRDIAAEFDELDYREGRAGSGLAARKLRKSV